MVSRKQFIEQVGATCKNWTWSWSFINEVERFVIFGLWDIYDSGDFGMILAEEWRYDQHGRKKQGFEQSKRHVDLIQNHGYRLKTFSMIWSGERIKDGGGTAAIKEFKPVLTDRRLTQIGSKWYASAIDVDTVKLSGPEENSSKDFVEGAVTTLSVNAYERNPEAREACLAHFGYTCHICQFDFEIVYGEIGRSFIHVHHVVPLSETSGEYLIDPIKDLIPVCPNCHAIIHRARPALTLEQVRECLNRTGATRAR